MSTASPKDYYVPHGTHWPIVGSIGLALTFIGFARFLHGAEMTTMFLGIAIVIFMMFGWFGQVIDESIAGTYNQQVDMSFRWGMGWFIFSEVMFFGAFFGASVLCKNVFDPWLGDASNNDATAWLLWPILKRFGHYSRCRWLINLKSQKKRWAPGDYRQSILRFF